MQRESVLQEQDLEELGIFRIPLPIPFRQAGGPVNVYVIEGEDGLLLFDTGLGTELSQRALAEGLARAGHRFDEISRIVISHGHVDHFGAAAWIQEQAGKPIPVMIHGADADKVLESGAYWPELLSRNRDYLASLGVPLPVLEEAAEMIQQNSGIGRRLARVTPLTPGERFRCRRVTLEVQHMPGHTPGVCCLYERQHRLFFSADHLLERVSPNPLMELSNPGSFKPLLTYFESLERVKSLAIDLVLPGHAEPFTAPLKVMESLADFYLRRQARVLDTLKNGPLTVYEVMRELFLSGGGFELVLMMSEALGNLEALEHKGRVKRTVDGGLIRFHPV